MFAGGRALGGGEIRRLQTWEGSCLFSNVRTWWGHMSMIRSVEGRRSPTSWTRRSGCPAGEMALGMSRMPLSLNQEGDRAWGWG